MIWCVGGEASGESPDASVRILAEGLAAGHGGNNLMGVHPTGNQSSGSRFHNETWLDFNMLQSGHVLDFANYDLITADYARTPVKPTFESEYFYEDFKRTSSAYRSTALDVRKGGYWSVFAGGFSYTHGHDAIWQFWNGGGDAKYPSTQPSVDWKTALGADGAGDMIHLRRLMESRPFLTRIPDQSLIVSGAGGGGTGVADHVQATRDGTAGANDATYLMAYTPVAKSLTVDTSVIDSSLLDAWWFDPRKGTATRFLSSAANTGSLAVTTPTAGPDWVLVVDDATKSYPAPGVSKRPRLLVTTDIGGDPDDQQSMRRLMLVRKRVRHSRAGRLGQRDAGRRTASAGAARSDSGHPGRLRSGARQPLAARFRLPDRSHARCPDKKRQSGPRRGQRRPGKIDRRFGSHHRQRRRLDPSRCTSRSGAARPIWRKRFSM